MRMRICVGLMAGGLAAMLAATASAATVKIGVIAPFSGPASEFGTSWREGIKAFMHLKGDTVDGNKIEIVYRDLPGPNPLQARSLAQELVIKEGVQYLAGFAYTPNVFALAGFADKARVPIVIMGASTSSIMGRSKYFLRTSLTVPQISVPSAIHALDTGHKSIVTMVPDYAPGWDSEKSFSRTFEHGGGKILAKIRMPFSTHDYVPYLNRAKLLHPDALFGFLPGGGSSYQFLNAYNNSGLHGQNVPYLGMTETTENVLQKYGDAVLGLVTVNYYSGAHRSAANDEFKKALAAVAPEAVAAPFQVSAFDGMYVIAHMIAATHGKKDGDKAVAAAAGLRWEAPQGPVEIDPKTHDFIQNIYVRRVEKDASGLLYNKEIGVYPLQPDYGRKGTPIPTVESLKMKPIAAK